jgi:hypothetical protein
MLLQEEWPKIKFYLFGIAARPTEKLAAQIILFAFQTIFFIKHVSTVARNLCIFTKEVGWSSDRVVMNENSI